MILRGEAMCLVVLEPNLSWHIALPRALPRPPLQGSGIPWHPSTVFAGFWDFRLWVFRPNGAARIAALGNAQGKPHIPTKVQSPEGATESIPVAGPGTGR